MTTGYNDRVRDQTDDYQNNLSRGRSHFNSRCKQGLSIQRVYKAPVGDPQCQYSKVVDV